MKNRKWSKLIMAGIGLAVLFWLLESLAHVVIFREGDFLRQVFAPAGHEIWMRSLVICLFILFAIYAQFNLNKRKQAEEAIKFAHTALEQIFNTTPDAMRVVDKDFNILRVNDTFTALTGVSREEAVNRKCHEVFPGPLCHTPDCPLTRIFGGEEPVECEVEKERNDSVRIPCLMTAVPFNGAGGRLIGIVENFKDITELQKTREQLQHSLLLSSLGEMTTGIAHEVNNPVATIMLYSELLLKSNLPGQNRKDLMTIHNEARRAARIMTQLLNYGHKLKPKVCRLDLQRVIKKVMDMRRYQLNIENITFSANLRNGPLYVRGDFAQLMQVFINLMLNAEEALTDSGGGHITVTTQVDGEWVKVSIADDGTGIPEENLSQVFYPFFTTKPAGKGTGLGLSACYGIVTGHGGLIHVANNEMGGTTFTVELPLAKARGRARKHTPEIERSGALVTP